MNQQNNSYYNSQNNGYDPQYQQNIQESNKSTRTALIVALVIIIICLGCCCIIPGIIGLNIFSNNKEDIKESVNEFIEDVSDENTSVDDGYDFEDLSGIKWVSTVDGYWEFTDDDTCYLNSDDGSYFETNYKVLYDDDAVDYIANQLSEYGVTKEEQTRVINGHDDYKHYICVVFENISYYENGELADGVAYDIVPYFGFMFDDGDCYQYELVGMNSSNYSYFSQDK